MWSSQRPSARTVEGGLWSGLGVKSAVTLASLCTRRAGGKTKRGSWSTRVWPKRRVASQKRELIQDERRTKRDKGGGGGGRGRKTERVCVCVGGGGDLVVFVVRGGGVWLFALYVQQ